MRIAVITSMKSGVSQFIYRDIEALIGKGHHLKVFTLRNRPGLYNPASYWHVIPLSWARLFSRNLWLLIRRPVTYVRLLVTSLRTRSLIDLAVAASFAEQLRDMDVIWAIFGDHKLYVGYYCKRLTAIPLVVTIHAYELHNNPNPNFFGEALSYCDQVITVCDFNKDFLGRHFEALPENIETVRHAIDLVSYRSEPKIKILIVGFFSEKKGHELLFKALKKLKRDDVELWVVGDTALDVSPVDCRRLARDLGVETQVAFFGAQGGNALRTLYRECDVFCLPSRTSSDGDMEGLPTVIAEAMAFGKPVVSTRHAGIPEAIDAVLVEEDNVEQLADALAEVCQSDDFRKQLGDKNREVAEQLFSMENIEKLEGIFMRHSTKRKPPQRQS